MGVDPDATGLELAGHAGCLLEVVGPHRGAKTHLRVVCAVNDILLVLPYEEGHDGTEWLFCDNAGVLLRVVDDGGGDEVAGLAGVVLAADSDVPLFLLNVVEECLDLLKLHAVLDGAEEDTLFVALASFEGLGKLDGCFLELGVDVLVHVDALDREANLARVQESEGGDLLGGRGDVNVLANNGGVVTTTIVVLASSCGRGAAIAYSSRVTRFSVLEADSMTFLPVNVLPVKEILAGPG